MKARPCRKFEVSIMVIQSRALGPPSGLVKSFLCLVTLGRKSPAAVWQRPVPVWSGTRGSCVAWFVHLSETLKIHLVPHCIMGQIQFLKHCAGHKRSPNLLFLNDIHCKEIRM